MSSAGGLEARREPRTRGPRRVLGEADWCGRDHLGGTLLLPDGIPRGMSPWFLSLQMMSAFADYGNGEATIIDLEHEDLTIG